MKPLQIALLVVAGALSGAVVMKVWQRPQPVVTPSPAPAVAQVETPSPAPVPATVPPPAPVPEEPAPAAPVAPVKRVTVPPVRPARKTVAAMERPLPRVHRDPPAPAPAPVMVAKSDPGRAQAPAPVQETPQEHPASPTTPPARSEPEQVTPAPPPPPEPHRVTLNAGTLVPVRLIDGLSTERNRPGDMFTGTLDKELVAGEFVIAERGARVEGRVVTADPGGKVKGVSSLAVELTRLFLSDGQVIPIRTAVFERRAEQSTRDDAAKIGGAAAVGAIIGAIAGGGKGAAIGAGVGGGAGTGDVLLTRGKAVTLPSETRIRFRLDSAVTITERTQ